MCGLQRRGTQNRTDAAEKDRLQQVVKGQEAYFDQVPGRAAGGRSANAPVRQRDRAVEEDDDEDDEAEEDEDDDAAYEDADEEDEEDNERKPAAPRAASSQRRRFADDAAEDRYVFVDEGGKDVPAPHGAGARALQSACVGPTI